MPGTGTRKRGFATQSATQFDLVPSHEKASVALRKQAANKLNWKSPSCRTVFGAGRSAPTGCPAAGWAPYIQIHASRISWRTEEADMAKTLIDVNEQYLAAAQEALHTETKKDTAFAARRRDLRRLASGGLPDLEDDDVMRAAWRQ